MLETIRECLITLDNQISYTDCMEISLLRFIQLLFINTDLEENQETYTFNFSKLNQSNIHPELLFFLERNNIIYKTKIDFENKGYDLRRNWCLFLNNRQIFEYIKENKYEVRSSFRNLVSFCNYFLKLDLENNTEYEPNYLFQILLNKFELNNFTINAIVFSYENKYKDSYISDEEITIYNNRMDCMICNNSTNWLWHITWRYCDICKLPGHSQIDSV